MYNIILYYFRELATLAFYLPIALYIIKFLFQISLLFQNYSFKESGNALSIEISKYCKSNTVIIIFTFMFIYGAIMNTGIINSIGNPFEPLNYTTKANVLISYDGINYKNVDAVVGRISHHDKLDLKLSSNYFIKEYELYNNIYEFSDSPSMLSEVKFYKDSIIVNDDDEILECILIKNSSKFNFTFNNQTTTLICIISYMAFLIRRNKSKNIIFFNNNEGIINLNSDIV